MPTKITNKLTPITANGDYYVEIEDPHAVYTVSINFTTAGSAGTITIKDAQENAYRNSDNSADLQINYNSTVTKYNLTPTGYRFNFTAAAFAGSPVAEVLVIKRKNKVN